ncbi:hypothetical protein P5704_027700 (plasmid) [Pseudomonas sp. FeN3W]|nr:hypothetical protein P5704_027700 [Pseudomonas sp. FeN3W]
MSTNKHTAIANTLETWANEIKDQVSLNENEDLSMLMDNKGFITLTVEDGKALAGAINDASRLINLLSLDSLQLDVHSDNLAAMRVQFDKLHAHFHQALSLIPKAAENRAAINKVDEEIQNFVKLLG